MEEVRNLAIKMCECCNKPSGCCFGNLIIGVGLGALLTYPFFGSHPVKWGIALIIVGLLGHLYPKIIKK